MGRLIQFIQCFVIIFLTDVAVLEHTRENQVGSVRKAAGYVTGTHLSGIGNHGGQLEGLACSQSRRGLFEIDLGGRFDAIDTVTPLDDIQIDFKDPSLGQLFFQAPGNEKFHEFPKRVLGGG